MENHALYLEASGGHIGHCWAIFIPVTVEGRLQGESEPYLETTSVSKLAHLHLNRQVGGKLDELEKKPQKVPF